MSKVKSPPEKKRQSLLNDRRNIYGECPTSSRKNISKGKQRSRKALRRAVGQELRTASGSVADFDADTVDARARGRLLEYKRASFRKLPDAPLAVVISRKISKRVAQQEGPTAPVEWNQVLQELRSEDLLLRGIKRQGK